MKVVVSRLIQLSFDASVFSYGKARKARNLLINRSVWSRREIQNIFIIWQLNLMIHFPFESFQKLFLKYLTVANFSKQMRIARIVLDLFVYSPNHHEWLKLIPFIHSSLVSVHFTMCRCVAGSCFCWWASRLVVVRSSFQLFDQNIEKENFQARHNNNWMLQWHNFHSI